MGTTKRILVVDDEETLCDILGFNLESEGYEVIYANNGKVGLEMYREARIIRQNDKKVIIFFLTDRTDKVDRLHGFSLKGNDYIPKPFYPEELVAKINERLESTTIGNDKEYRIGDTLFRPNLSTITYQDETHNLSVRQSEILQILAENIGRPVDREYILSQVWGDTSYANSLALNVQITYLRKLIDDPSITISSIKKRGYILSATH